MEYEDQSERPVAVSTPVNVCVVHDMIFADPQNGLKRICKL